MITCTRKLHWCMGHRLLDHEGKCAYLHGHNYRVEITARVAVAQNSSRKELDETGRIVDFAILKEVYDPWINNNWDHGFLLNNADVAGIQAIDVFDIEQRKQGKTAQKLYIVPWNPTAENIAKFLLHDNAFVQALALYDVRVYKVRVEETDNCFSTATL